MKTLKEELVLRLADALSKTAGKIPYVNSGGCGFAAKYLKDALDRLGVECAVAVVCFSDKITTEEMVGSYRRPWSHVLIRMGEMFVDATGVFAKDREEAYVNARMIYGDPKIAELDGDLDEVVAKAYWNPVFNKNETVRLRLLIEEAVANVVGPYARAQC